MPLVHGKPDKNTVLEQLTAEVCEDCYAKLLRALTGRVRCGDTARDIAQEAFSRLLVSASETTIQNPLGYLFHVAGQLAVDHRRAGDRTRREELGASAWESLPAPTVALDDMVDSRRCLNQLEEAVATLPPRCQRVFVLCKVAGYSHEEVAALLKISRSAVEKHVMHGVFLLRKRLGDMVVSRSGAPGMGAEQEVKR